METSNVRRPNFYLRPLWLSAKNHPPDHQRISLPLQQPAHCIPQPKGRRLYRDVVVADSESSADAVGMKTAVVRHRGPVDLPPPACCKHRQKRGGNERAPATEQQGSQTVNTERNDRCVPSAPPPHPRIAASCSPPLPFIRSTTSRTMDNSKSRRWAAFPSVRSSGVKQFKVYSHTAGTSRPTVDEQPPEIATGRPALEAAAPPDAGNLGRYRRAEWKPMGNGRGYRECERRGAAVGACPYGGAAACGSPACCRGPNGQIQQQVIHPSVTAAAAAATAITTIDASKAKYSIRRLHQLAAKQQHRQQQHHLCVRLYCTKVLRG
jgi:hypothetical protein